MTESLMKHWLFKVKQKEPPRNNESWNYKNEKHRLRSLNSFYFLHISCNTWKNKKKNSKTEMFKMSKKCKGAVIFKWQINSCSFLNTFYDILPTQVRSLSSTKYNHDKNNSYEIPKCIWLFIVLSRNSAIISFAVYQIKMKVFTRSQSRSEQTGFCLFLVIILS